MKLSEKAITAVRESTRLRNMIAVECDCHFSTVERWSRENNDNLTKAAVLDLIHKETGIPKYELLTEKTEA